MSAEVDIVMENDVSTASNNVDNNDQDSQLLTFCLGRQFYGIDITNVDQIISMQEITEIPEYPVYAKGVVSLRGSIIPVIDLRLRLGKEETVYTERTCIIITSIEDTQLGCIVDEVDSVIRVSKDQIALPPRMTKENMENQCLVGIVELPDDNNGSKMVLYLDISKVLLRNEFAILTNMSN